MRISIIIPCFHAVETIGRAVSSIIAQRPLSDYAHQYRVEVVLAADDHHDYTFIRSLCPNAIIVPPVKGRFGTGPGATRNRGIAAASGEILGFLDADDEWSADYLLELLPLALHYGAAFAPTEIVRAGGDHLLTLAEGQSVLTPADFGHWPGSFQPLLKRVFTQGFSDGAGQDVFHALSVMGHIGGRAPLAPSARYKLHLKSDSVTADAGFGRKIDKRYRDHIRAYQRKDTTLHGMARLQAIRALYRRIWWNNAWLNAACTIDNSMNGGFYGYVTKIKKQQ